MDSARHQAARTPASTGRPPQGGATPVEPSTGVMKALVLVDALRDERRTGDDARRANLMGHPHRRH